MTSDVQNLVPEDRIELEKVGVEGLKKYVVVKRPDKNYHAIVKINSYITLPAHQKGAHMSRFVESVEEIPQEVGSIEELARQIADNVLKKHNLDCYTEVFSNLPFEKDTNNGKKENSVARMFSSYSTRDKIQKVGVSILGALACPCSKEMCNGLTHNQRARLSVEIFANKDIELLEILNICNSCFSSPVFSLLKRPDEKMVVENMHKNPMFVEDAVRKCVKTMKQRYSGCQARVKCTSFESIHDHNAVSVWEGVL